MDDPSQDVEGTAGIVNVGEIHSRVIYIYAGHRQRVSPPMSAEEEVLLERYRASDQAQKNALLRAALGD